MKQPLNPQRKPAAKKPYNSPEIQVYGDFREITNTSTNRRPFGVTDHGILNRTK
jgi:hypothetical protein